MIKIRNGSTQKKKVKLKISPLNGKEEKREARGHRKVISWRKRNPTDINQQHFGEERYKNLVGFFFFFLMIHVVLSTLWLLIKKSKLLF